MSGTGIGAYAVGKIILPDKERPGDPYETGIFASALQLAKKTQLVRFLRASGVVAGYISPTKSLVQSNGDG